MTGSENTPQKLPVEVCRSVPSTASIRAKEGEGNDASRTMEGHFSVFENWYEIRSYFEGEFLERVSPGAFKKTFKESRDKIQVLLEHGYDPTVANKPLGKAVELEEDESGARYKVDLFDTSYVRDLIPALEAGVYGSSFRFKVMKDEWKHSPDPSDDNPEGLPERTITEVKVSEFGPTIYPANPEATAGVRSTTDEWIEQLRSNDTMKYDSVLRSLNVSKEEFEDSRSTSPEGETNSVTTESERSDEDEAAESRTEPPEEHSENDADRSTDSGDESEEVTQTHVERETTNMDRMTVEERTLRLSEIRARLAEIDSEFSGAALPAQVDSEWRSLDDEYRQHELAIEDDKRRKARIAEIAGDGTDTNGTTRATERGGSAAFHKSTNIYDIEEVRNSSSSVDEMRSKLRDNALRAVEGGRFGGTSVPKAEAQENIERLLNYTDDKESTIARRILTTGHPTYERAFGKAVMSKNLHSLTAEESRSLQLGVDADGGFAVPFQLDPTVILTSDGRINPLRNLARVEQITGKEWQGITSEGVVVSRVAESTEATDNSPTLAQPSVKAERVQGFVPFSIEIDQDWTQLRSEMARMLADAKEQEEAEAFLNGTGTAPDANGLITTLDASSEVAESTSGSFLVEDLYAVKNAVPPRFRANGTFLGETSTYDDIRQFGNGSDGADLWTRLADGTPGNLIGYRAVEASEMTAHDDAVVDDRYLLFGDFRQFLIVDRVGMSVELIPHLFGATNRFPTGQRGLYAIWRNNSLILTDNAFRVLVKGV